MFTFIFVIVVFCLSIYFYWDRGPAVQLAEVVFMGLAYGLIQSHSLDWASQLKLWIPYPGQQLDAFLALYPRELISQMDTVYYRACASLLIIFALTFIKWVFFYLLGSGKRRKRNLLPHALSSLVVGTLAAWFALFFIFSFFSLLPIEGIQHYFQDNAIAQFFVTKTPFLSTRIFRLWFTGIANIR